MSLRRESPFHLEQARAPERRFQANRTIRTGCGNAAERGTLANSLPEDGEWPANSAIHVMF